MTFGEYQAAARRTQNPALKFFEMREHALCGLAAEVGEVHLYVNLLPFKKK